MRTGRAAPSARHPDRTAHNGLSALACQVDTVPRRVTRVGIAPSRRAQSPELDVLYPLNVAYAQIGLPVPNARAISSAELPAACRLLLNHDDSMTLTLERYAGQRLMVRLLSVALNEPWCLRRVILAERSGRPLEMGAVRLNLDVFSHAVRDQILRGKVPLGRILMANCAAYRSRPNGFLKITPGSEMMGMFWMSHASPLYGRQADLLCRGVMVGHVLEVLAPLTER